MTLEYTYTGRDFTSEYNRLIALLQSELPEYTDLNHSDAGIVLIRLLARETDQLNNYIDRVFSEGFLQTALFKQSLIELGRLVDYLPKLSSAATTTVMVTRNSEVDEDIIIPANCLFSRTNGIVYTNTEAQTMTENNMLLNVVQGEVLAITKTSADFEIVDWSGFYKINLGSGVVSGYVSMQHGTSPVYTWEEVDSFFRSTLSDNHFLLELDENDDVWLVARHQPPTLTDISISFLKTDGKTGNCGAGLVINIPNELAGYISSVTNTSIANGGSDAETVSSIRENISKVARTQRRGVTVEDYQTLVSQVSGVLWCQCVDRNNSGDIPYLHVFLYVVPSGGGPISNALREKILNKLQSWGHMQNWTNRYVIQNAEECPVDVAVRIGITAGYNSSTVIASVMSSLTDLFDVENRGISEPLSFTELHYAVQNTTGVSYCEFTTPLTDVFPGNGEIITSGSFTVTAA